MSSFEQLGLNAATAILEVINGTSLDEDLMFRDCLSNAWPCFEEQYIRVK